MASEKISKLHLTANSNKGRIEEKVDNTPPPFKETVHGPFPLVYKDCSDDSDRQNNFNQTDIEEIRNYDCSNYSNCFALVAALNWDGFTCSGCEGELNQQLLWRAQGECAKDETLQVICKLPSLKERNIVIDEKNDIDTSFHGLRLVVNNCDPSSDQGGD
jgi:hypothetical protein